MDSQAYSGLSLHFTYMQPLDQYVSGPLSDENKNKTDVIRLFRQQFGRVSIYGMDFYAQSTIGGQQKISDTQQTLYKIDLTTNSDFVQKIYMHVQLPSVDLKPADTKVVPEAKQFSYVKNVGHALIQNAKFQISQQPQDVNTTENLDFYYKTFLRRDQYNVHQQMIGNIPEHTEMASVHKAADLLVPLNFFINKGVQTAFPTTMAQESTLSVQFTLRAMQDIVQMTRLASQDLTWLAQASQQVRISVILLEVIISDSERYVLVREERSIIIEQRQFVVSNQKLGTENSIGFLHPIKYIAWHARNKKYTRGDYFFSDGQNPAQFAARFVLRYALYQCTTKFALVSTAAVNGSIPAGS